MLLMIVMVGSDALGLGIPISTLTPAGLLAVVILFIAMGRLVPRRTMDDVIHDRDEWRAAHRLSEQARVELAESVTELLEHARTTNALLKAFPYGSPHPRYQPEYEQQPPPGAAPGHQYPPPIPGQ
jgi:hypothetical protein